MQPALEAITPDGLLAHIKVLASDEFEGRAPGTKGEELSVKYISDQFKKIGLKPGNPDGTYTQEVPLAGIKSEPRMSFITGDKMIDLKYPDDFVASSARLQPEIKIDKSDVVFVGYGVVAPEYKWDDYAGIDVTGKTVMVLTGDPFYVDQGGDHQLRICYTAQPPARAVQAARVLARSIAAASRAADAAPATVRLV